MTVYSVVVRFDFLDVRLFKGKTRDGVVLMVARGTDTNTVHTHALLAFRIGLAQ